MVDETFGNELVHVQSTSGTGYKRNIVDITKMVENKKSVIQIKNRDLLCCARAIVTAIARIEKHPKWNSIRQGLSIQKELATDLHVKADVPFGECGIKELSKFQEILPKYQIHVLSKEHFNAFVHSGPEGGIPIYLYCHDRHYDVITKMTGFLNRNYFCLNCKKGYDHKETHSCNNPCHYCRRLHSNEEEDWKHCQACNCKFINETCFYLHLVKSERGKATCDLYYKCN